MENDVFATPGKRRGEFPCCLAEGRREACGWAPQKSNTPEKEKGD
jgi:hypothetical protein